MKPVIAFTFLFFILITSCKKKNELPKTNNSSLYKERTWLIAKRTSTGTLDTTYYLPDDHFAVYYVDESSVGIPSFSSVEADTLVINADGSNDTVRLFTSQHLFVDNYLAYYPAKDSIAITSEKVTSFGPQQNVQYAYIYAHSK
jgi:hypothetical protein